MASVQAILKNWRKRKSAELDGDGGPQSPGGVCIDGFGPEMSGAGSAASPRGGGAGDLSHGTGSDRTRPNHPQALNRSERKMPVFDKKQLQERLVLEEEMLAQIPRCCLFLAQFIVFLIMLWTAYPADKLLPIRQALINGITINDMQPSDVTSLADLKDYLPGIAASWKTFSPGSSLYVEDPLSRKYLSVVTEVPPVINLGSEALQPKVGPQFTLVAWVNSNIRFDTIIKKVQPDRANAICWQFDWERVFYGQHETKDPVIIVHPLAADIWQDGADDEVVWKNSSFRAINSDGKWHQHAYMVTVNTMTFFLDGEPKGTVTLPRPLTDCTKGIVTIGSTAKKANLVDVQYIPRLLTQVDLAFIRSMGRVPDDVLAGSGVGESAETDMEELRRLSTDSVSAASTQADGTRAKLLTVMRQLYTVLQSSFAGIAGDIIDGNDKSDDALAGLEVIRQKLGDLSTTQQETRDMVEATQSTVWTIEEHTGSISEVEGAINRIEYDLCGAGGCPEPPVDPLPPVRRRLGSNASTTTNQSTTTPPSSTSSESTTSSGSGGSTTTSSGGSESTTSSGSGGSTTTSSGGSESTTSSGSGGSTTTSSGSGGSTTTSSGGSESTTSSGSGGSTTSSGSGGSTTTSSGGSESTTSSGSGGSTTTSSGGGSGSTTSSSGSGSTTTSSGSSGSTTSSGSGGTTTTSSGGGSGSTTSSSGSGASTTTSSMTSTESSTTTSSGADGATTETTSTSSTTSSDSTGANETTNSSNNDTAGEDGVDESCVDDAACVKMVAKETLAAITIASGGSALGKLAECLYTNGFGDGISNDELKSGVASSDPVDGRHPLLPANGKCDVVKVGCEDGDMSGGSPYNCISVQESAYCNGTGVDDKHRQEWDASTGRDSCCSCGGGTRDWCTDEPGFRDPAGRTCADFDRDSELCQASHEESGWTMTPPCCSCGGGRHENTTVVDFRATFAADIDASWSDYDGHDCAWYADNNVCRPDGSKGTGWYDTVSQIPAPPVGHEYQVLWDGMNPQDAWDKQMSNFEHGPNAWANCVVCGGGALVQREEPSRLLSMISTWMVAGEPGVCNDPSRAAENRALCPDLCVVCKIAMLPTTADLSAKLLQCNDLPYVDWLGQDCSYYALHDPETSDTQACTRYGNSETRNKCLRTCGTCPYTKLAMELFDVDGSNTVNQDEFNALVLTIDMAVSTKSTWQSFVKAGICEAEGDYTEECYTTKNYPEVRVDAFSEESTSDGAMAFKKAAAGFLGAIEEPVDFLPQDTFSRTLRFNDPIVYQGSSNLAVQQETFVPVFTPCSVHADCKDTNVTACGNIANMRNEICKRIYEVPMYCATKCYTGGCGMTGNVMPGTVGKWCQPCDGCGLEASPSSCPSWCQGYTVAASGTFPKMADSRVPMKRPAIKRTQKNLPGSFTLSAWVRNFDTQWLFTKRIKIPGLTNEWEGYNETTHEMVCYQVSPYGLQFRNRWDEKKLTLIANPLQSKIVGSDAWHYFAVRKSSWLDTGNFRGEDLQFMVDGEMSPLKVDLLMGERVVEIPNMGFPDCGGQALSLSEATSNGYEGPTDFYNREFLPDWQSDGFIWAGEDGSQTATDVSSITLPLMPGKFGSTVVSFSDIGVPRTAIVKAAYIQFCAARVLAEYFMEADCNQRASGNKTTVKIVGLKVPQYDVNDEARYAAPDTYLCELTGDADLRTGNVTTWTIDERDWRNRGVPTIPHALTYVESEACSVASPDLTDMVTELLEYYQANPSLPIDMNFVIKDSSLAWDECGKESIFESPDEWMQFDTEGDTCRQIQVRSDWMKSKMPLWTTPIADSGRTGAHGPQLIIKYCLNEECISPSFLGAGESARDTAATHAARAAAAASTSVSNAARRMQAKQQSGRRLAGSSTKAIAAGIPQWSLDMARQALETSVRPQQAERAKAHNASSGTNSSTRTSTTSAPQTTATAPERYAYGSAAGTFDILREASIEWMLKNPEHGPNGTGEGLPFGGHFHIIGTCSGGGCAAPLPSSVVRHTTPSPTRKPDVTTPPPRHRRLDAPEALLSQGQSSCARPIVGAWRGAGGDGGARASTPKAAAQSSSAWARSCNTKLAASAKVRNVAKPAEMPTIENAPRRLQAASTGCVSGGNSSCMLVGLVVSDGLATRGLMFSPKVTFRPQETSELQRGYYAALDFLKPDGQLEVSGNVQFVENQPANIAKYPLEVVSIIPPIIFQRRSPQVSCGDFTPGLAHSLESYFIRQNEKRCSQAYACSQISGFMCIDRSKSLSKDALHFDTRTTIIDDVAWYPEILDVFSVPTVYRGGNGMVSTSDWIDLQTSEVMLVNIFVAPQYRAGTLVTITWNIQAGKVTGDTDTKSFVAMAPDERQAWYTMNCLVAILASLDLVLLAVSVFLRWRRRRQVVRELTTGAYKLTEEQEDRVTDQLVLISAIDIFDVVLRIINLVFAFWHSTMYPDPTYVEDVPGGEKKTLEFIEKNLKDILNLQWGDPNRTTNEKVEDFMEKVILLKTDLLKEEDHRFWAKLLVILFFIRVVIYMRVHPRIAILYATLIEMFADFMHFLLLASILFCVLAFLGCWSFGDSDPNFGDFWTAMYTQFRMLIGEFGMPTDEKSGFSVTYGLYYVIYFFMVFSLLLNFFLAIVIDSYANVKDSVKDCQIEASVVWDIGACFFYVVYAPLRGWPHRGKLITQLMRTDFNQDGHNDEEQEAVPLHWQDFVKFGIIKGDKAAKAFMHYYHRVCPAMDMNAVEQRTELEHKKAMKRLDVVDQVYYEVRGEHWPGKPLDHVDAEKSMHEVLKELGTIKDCVKEQQHLVEEKLKARDVMAGKPLEKEEDLAQHMSDLREAMLRELSTIKERQELMDEKIMALNQPLSSMNGQDGRSEPRSPTAATTPRAPSAPSVSWAATRSDSQAPPAASASGSNGAADSNAVAMDAIHALRQEMTMQGLRGDTRLKAIMSMLNGIQEQLKASNTVV